MNRLSRQRIRGWNVTGKRAGRAGRWRNVIQFPVIPRPGQSVGRINMCSTDGNDGLGVVYGEHREKCAVVYLRNVYVMGFINLL